MATAADHLRDLFRFIDANDDGTLDRAELLMVLQGDDPTKWTESRIDAIIANADVNKDGVIQYEEFVTWLCETGEDQAEFNKVAERLSPDAVNSLVRSISERSAKSGEDGLVGLVPALDELESAPWEQKEAAITLMLKLLNNVANNPGEAKFRRLKKGNKTLAQKIFSVKGCMEFLLAAGFVDEGEELVLPDGVDVGWVVDELQSFGNKELTSKLRADRDAKIAARKAEDAQARKLKGMAAGGSGDDAERQKILQQAEYDRQERAARDKLAAEGFREANAVPAEKAGGAVTRFSDIGVDLNRGGG